jgi:hypothetical protein
MPSLQRAVATLRVMGDDLDPQEVTRILGQTPTHAESKGDIRIGQRTGTRIVARTGIWRLDAMATEPADIGAQVEELFARLIADVAAWKGLAAAYRVDLFCGWFMEGRNEGIEIAPATLAKLAERGIALSLDIYAPERDA